jgi:ParB/RepB/Spo0J family partition protein
MSSGAELLDADLAEGEVGGYNADAAGNDEAAQEEKLVFTRAASKPQTISLALIRKSDVALRGVQRQTEGYQLLVDSVKKRGVYNSITVREQKDPSTGAIFYALVDGLQRFTAATDAGLTEIPANVVSMDDAEVLEAQLITNLQKIQTKPADISKHLLRILARNPFMTKMQLAERCSQSLTWVEQRLGLANLSKEIQELVNQGKIHLTNAYALSKLDEANQKEFVEASMTESPKTFVPRMKARLKEVRDANKTGRDSSTAEFQPVQHLQKAGDVKKEMETAATGEALIKKYGLPEAAIEGWILHFDEDSKAEQKRDWDRRKAERDAEKEKMKKEREAEKERKAAAALEDVSRGF